jgi:Tfp pilus assembly protein PilP
MTTAGGVLASALVAIVVAAPRDPFVPPSSPRPAATPLERLPLDQLRLVALVYRPVARALLEDAEGIGYVAAPGTRIGPAGATVVGIEPGRLRIREPASREETVLKLHPPAGATR